MTESSLEKAFCQTLPSGGRREHVRQKYYDSLTTHDRKQNVQGMSSKNGREDGDRNMKDYKKTLSPIGKMRWNLGKWLAKDQFRLLKEKHEGEIAQLTKEHQDKITEMDQHYQDEIKRLNKKHQDEMERLYKEHQDEIDRLEAKLEHQEQVQQNDTKRHDKEIEELKQVVSMLTERAEHGMEWQIGGTQRLQSLNV